MSFVNPNRFTTRPEIQGTFGVVASTHWIATAVGMGILERGGNAFDAGVATAFTLQIVERLWCKDRKQGVFDDPAPLR
jgi:gamma-glutamyltranspeptidase / glutathione hydrolase